MKLQKEPFLIIFLVKKRFYSTLENHKWNCHALEFYSDISNIRERLLYLFGDLFDRICEQFELMKLAVKQLISFFGLLS